MYRNQMRKHHLRSIHERGIKGYKKRKRRKKKEQKTKSWE